MEPSSDLVDAGVVRRKVADKDQTDWPDIELLIPFEQKAEELHCLNMQMDQDPQMGWGLVLRILAAD